MSERDELVARLRNSLGAGIAPTLWFNRAADQIERDGRKIERLREQLRLIAAADEVDMLLDPTWATRIARAALRSTEASHG